MARRRAVARLSTSELRDEIRNDSLTAARHRAAAHEMERRRQRALPREDRRSVLKLTRTELEHEAYNPTASPARRRAVHREIERRTAKLMRRR